MTSDDWWYRCNFIQSDNRLFYVVWYSITFVTLTIAMTISGEEAGIRYYYSIHCDVFGDDDMMTSIWPKRVPSLLFILLLTIVPWYRWWRWYSLILFYSSRRTTYDEKGGIMIDWLFDTIIHSSLFDIIVIRFVMTCELHYRRKLIGSPILFSIQWWLLTDCVSLWRRWWPSHSWWWEISMTSQADTSVMTTLKKRSLWPFYSIH